MTINKIYLLFLVLSVNLFGQTSNRRALFLHGYDSDNSAWTSGTETPNTPNGTPSYLVNEGIIDGFSNPSLPPFTDEVAMGIALENATSNFANDDWIIVGHSLGGLVGRKAAPLFTDNINGATDLDDINLLGVLTLGTPHQGAPVANLDGNNAQAEITAFRNGVLAAPQWEITYGASLVNAIITTVTPQVDLLSATLAWGIYGVVRIVYEIFAYYLNDLYDKVNEMISNSSGNGANALIPGSVELQALNNLSLTPLPDNYLSISGVEDSPSVVRMASKLGFSGDMNEMDVLYLFNGVKNKFNYFYLGYRTAKNTSIGLAAYYTAIFNWPAAALNAAAAVYFNQGQQKWYGSYNKIKTIDTKWAQLHNGDLLQTSGTYQQRYWHDCGTGSPPGGWDNDFSVEELELLFDLPGCSDPEAIALGGFWNYRTVSYTSWVPDKSDGFIPVNRTRWKTNDPYPERGNVNTNGANKNNTNIYFDGQDEADGGYNHWELRDITRDYGQMGISQPMKTGKQWMNERFLN